MNTYTEATEKSPFHISHKLLNFALPPYFGFSLLAILLTQMSAMIPAGNKCFGLYSENNR